MLNSNQSKLSKFNQFSLTKDEKKKVKGGNGSDTKIIIDDEILV